MTNLLLIISYRLVYDENNPNSAIDVTKEENLIYSTAICYPGVFDLGVFVQTGIIFIFLLFHIRLLIIYSYSNTIKEILMP